MSEQQRRAHDGKVAVITGASRGIGRAIAERLCRDGAQLVLGYRSDDAAMEAVAAACTEASGEAPEVVGGDLGSRETTDALVDRALERFGRLDLLVNNAAAATDDLLATLSDDAIEAMVSTNVVALVRLCRAALRPMVRQRSGCIINLSSALARQPGRGNAVYAGTKGFVESFTRALAAEVGRKQIRIVAVAPGVVETAMSRSVLAVARETIIERIAARRLGTAEEIAALVSYLASSDAAYINGAVIPIDGGFGAW